MRVETMNRDRWDTAVARKRAQWGDKLDLSDINQDFTPWYHRDDIRLEVVTPWGETLHGWVGCTTGWRPSLLLMRRVDSIGSSDVIGQGWEVKRWKWRGDRHYRLLTVSPATGDTVIFRDGRTQR